MSLLVEMIEDQINYVRIDDNSENCLIDLGYILKNNSLVIGQGIKVPFTCFNNNCIVTYKDWRIRFSLKDKIPQNILRKLSICYKLKNNDSYSDDDISCPEVRAMFSQQEKNEYLSKYHDLIADVYRWGRGLEKIGTISFYEEVEGVKIYEEDYAPDEIVKMYKERHKSPEDIETIRFRLLGIYCPQGYGIHNEGPCVVLFPKNIANAAEQLNKEYNLDLLDADAIKSLKEFVKNHELSHAFFDLNRNGNQCDIKIEECLANYSALIRAVKEPSYHNTLAIGKALVDHQSSLSAFNPGYNYALQLFDDNFRPKLTGWWKWRYCCNLIEDVSYKTLSEINDFIDVLDIKVITSRTRTEPM